MNQPSAEEALEKLATLVGEWTLWREGEPFAQRFAGAFSEDGNTISGRWEKAEDGTHHTTDFFLTYRRVDPRPR